MTLKELLIRHEGKRTRPYLCTAGKRTIGVGHNFDDNPLPPDIDAFLEDNGYITDEMIDTLLEQDIEDATGFCHKLYPNFDSFTENRQNALIDFLFVGYGTAKQFKNTNRAINEERWDDAADGLLASKYARQVGKRARDLASMLRDG